jgi:hypothetical protein
MAEISADDVFSKLLGAYHVFVRVHASTGSIDHEIDTAYTW